MRRALVVCGLLLVVAVAPAAAQVSGGTRNPVPHQQQITANPLGPMVGWGNAEYERKLAETWSIALGGSYVSREFFGEYASAVAALRFYPQGAVLTGFYFGPRFGFFRIYEDHEHSLGAGFELGYAWLLGASRHFSIGVGAGATHVFTGHGLPVLRLVNLGWAF